MLLVLKNALQASEWISKHLVSRNSTEQSLVSKRSHLL